MMVVKVVVALAALAAVALGAGGINADHKFAPVPRELAVAPAGQVVVGLSAGAYFTVQYHMAFSSSLRGAGVIAGGPFYCAADSQTNALVACMSQPELISVGSSVAAAQACAQGGVCDSLDNLSLQRVYLFSGTQDSVVAPGVMVKLQEMYSQFMPNASITTEFSIDAEHSWPTNSYGASCATLGSPYINDCNYDASYAALSAVFGSPLAQPVTANASALHELDQDSYVPGGSASAVSMGPNAYVYAPARCSAVGAQCPLVIAVHGCEQSIDSIGFDFIQYIGLNELAEANGFVVLYPQFIASYFPVTNPNACADWWGYTGSDYANQKGPQMAAVRAMASALANSQSRK